MRNHLKSPSYRPDIDGLRAIAVLAVLGFHAFPRWVTGGFVGVDVFFVISGFLITTLVSGNIRQNKFDFAAFYARRIRRLFPALIVVLIASCLFGYFFLLDDEFEQLVRHAAGSAAFIANFVLWHEAGYFDNAAEAKPLLHIWSLGIEEQFYIVWPLLLYLGHRYRGKLVWLMIGLLALGSFAADALTVSTDVHAAFYSPFLRFWELLLGALVAVTLPKLRAPRKNLGPNIAALSGFALIGGSIFLLDKFQPFPGLLALPVTAGTCLVILGGTRAWLNRTFLAHRVLVGIGLISYPLYLWHWPLLSFYYILENKVPPPAVAASLLAASSVLAVLTYFLVEKPLRFGPHPEAKTFALCFGLFFVGTGSYATSYLMFGLDANDNDIMTNARDMYGDVDCRKSLGLTPLKGEICTSKTAQPKILLTGDSHAFALYLPTFVGESMELYSAMVIAARGCLPFLDYSTGWQGEDFVEKNCINAAADILADARNIPSIEKVVLVSRGPYYFSHLDFHLFDGEEQDNITTETIFDKDGRPVDDPRRAFVDGYSDLIGRLIALGKKVVFVIEWPELGIEPHACIANRPGAMGCKYSRAIFDNRQREYRLLVDEIKRRNPQLLIYDGTSSLCDENYCYGSQGKDIYYRDNDHFTVSGAKRYLKAFGPWLAEQ